MRRFFLALGLGLALAGPVAALDLGNMTPTEKTAFDAEVRSYLLAHPEVLVEAIKSLDAKQARQQAQSDADMVKANAPALFKDPNSWVGGNPHGNVTLVEFMDYRCTYCRHAYQEVNNLVKTDGHIRFIVKELPILGPQSDLSSRFAIAVLQAKGAAAYAKVHDALMTFRGEITQQSLAVLSKKFGLNTQDIFARMNSDAVTKIVNENRALAGELQIQGTPTFVLADQMLRGYVPEAAMKQMVAKIRAGQG